MNNNYESMIDKIFCPDGGMYNHRTLRTVFDLGSAEWDQTSLIEKKNIIATIIEHHNLDVIMMQYKSRYSDRNYIINSINNSLSCILCFVLKNEDKIDGLEHYKRYPCMKPWVGRKYINSDHHKRLLIIGESHYLPEESTTHLNINKWYLSNQSNLTDKEMYWISTSEIIKESMQANFSIKAHGIYRNFCKEINKSGLHYENSADAIKHIVFYNYFQRPAEKTGDSIQIGEKDIKIASDVLLSNIEEFQPEIVIFVSALAGGYGKKIVQEKGIPCAVTPHPTCQWWNRYAEKYDGTGREIISKFLQEEMWIT